MTRYESSLTAKLSSLLSCSFVWLLALLRILTWTKCFDKMVIHILKCLACWEYGHNKSVFVCTYFPPANLQSIQNWKEWLFHHDCAAIQREFHGLKKRANRNLINFNKWKCEILHLWKNIPMHWCMLRASWLERRFVEIDLGVLMNMQWNMQLCPCRKGGQQLPGLH